MAKRSSAWGTIFIVLLLGIIGLLSYILIATPTAKAPQSSTPTTESGVVREGVSNQPKVTLEPEEVAEDAEQKDEETLDEETSAEPEATGEVISDFAFEGGLSATDTARIERIINESQGHEVDASDYEYIQGSPILSEDQSKIYFLSASSNHEFVGVYEMVLDGYEWTRIYRREYKPEPEIAILRLAGRDGENLVVLAGNWPAYVKRNQECYFPILDGLLEEDGLLALHIDEDGQTGLEEYELPQDVQKHVEALHQACVNN